MTWVKICGITNLEDARVAVEAGTDALGFVFYEKSPRAMKPDAVKKIIAGLPQSVETVGVFLDHSLPAALSVAEQAGLQAVQWHQANQDLRAQAETSAGSKELEACSTSLKLYFAFPATDFVWKPSGERSRISGIFLDSSSGRGRTFDWEASKPLVACMSRDVNVVVAGGLNPNNVAQAIAILHPYGVDVASGVEASPGKKDPEKVRAFIRNVREADKSA